MDQWNRTEPRNRPANPQSINPQQGKNIQRSKDSLFNKWYWKNRTATCKSMKLEQSLTPYTQKILNWLKDLNIRHLTIKLPEENTGKAFSDINHINGFLGQSPRQQK